MVRSLLGEDDGVSKLILTKVKAHSSLASCGADPEQIYRRGGNSISDCAAKEGARAHPIDDAILEERKTKFWFVRAFAQFFGHIAEWRWLTFGRKAFFGDPVEGIVEGGSDVAIVLPTDWFWRKVCDGDAFGAFKLLRQLLGSRR